ncbi:gastrula zinc finger protein XlCGF57.1-like [Achroia grisella]|uniref:gastrula zinc finger protein XlCGF57.1-like n=1 Tax=Achroia grisella TaxID=688607 RepID=UPI0027D3332E|nr:gastrula zinc finger protein XlCGF57.1-like [Achroia grisella]
MDLKLCRVCLKENGTISLFEKCENTIYSAKIMQFVNINIIEGDGLPDSMCDSCANELDMCFRFIRKCEASDQALHCLSVIEVKLEEIKNEDINNELNLSADSDIYLDDFTKLETPEPESDEAQLKISRKRNKRSKNGPIQCVVCGMMKISHSAMEIHMRSHTGEKPYPCLVCKAKFKTKGSLKRHNETRHLHRERKFTCETCGNSFYRKNDIIIHMRVHTDERPYSCMFCSKKFRQIASLIRHKRIHTGEKPYSCPICGKKFSDNSLVTKHLNVHTDEKKYTCHLCSKSVKSKSALTTHMGLHSNEKLNICTFCGMAFSMKGNLQTHIRRIHSEKSGQCSVCFKNFSDLEVHMRKHTGEKPFVCKLCNQGFATKRSLSHHKAFKHENASKYKCSIGDCSRTFPTVMMLEFHLLKQHTNNTPYVCQHCSRGFFRTSDLSRHLKVSHMDTIAKVPLKLNTA